MTRTTNARIAGFTLLLYIALGITAMILFGKAISGEGINEKLAHLAEYASNVRLAAVLNLFSGFAAIVLGVTLFAITREEDFDVAMLGLAFRVGEGVIGGLSIQRSLGLLWLATTTGVNAPDSGSAHALGSFFLGQTWSPIISATFFAMGSIFFSWLFLRGRMIPIALAWLGVIASALLIVGLPLQLAGVLSGSVVQLMWLPMLLFEVPLAFWLLIKGIRPYRTTESR